jgi:hypothetical protein
MEMEIRVTFSMDFNNLNGLINFSVGALELDLW